MQELADECPHLPQARDAFARQAGTWPLDKTIGPFFIPIEAWATTGTGIARMGNFSVTSAGDDNGIERKRAFLRKAGLDLVWFIRERVLERIEKFNADSTRPVLAIQLVPRVDPATFMAHISGDMPFLPYKDLQGYALWVLADETDDGDIRDILDADIEELIRENTRATIPARQASQLEHARMAERRRVLLDFRNGQRYSLDATSQPLTDTFVNRRNVADVYATFMNMPTHEFRRKYDFDESRPFTDISSRVKMTSLFCPKHMLSEDESWRMVVHDVVQDADGTFFFNGEGRGPFAGEDDLRLTSDFVLVISNTVQSHSDLACSLFPAFGCPTVEGARLEHGFEASHVILGHAARYTDRNPFGTLYSTITLCEQVVSNKLLGLALSPDPAVAARNVRDARKNMLPFIDSVFYGSVDRVSDSARGVARYVEQSLLGKRSEHSRSDALCALKGFDATSSLLYGLYVQAEELFGVDEQHTIFVLAFLIMRQCGMRHRDLFFNLVIAGAAGAGKSFQKDLALACTPGDHYQSSSYESERSMLVDPDHEEHTLANYILTQDEFYHILGQVDVQQKTAAYKEGGDNNLMANLLKEALTSMFLSYRRNVEGFKKGTHQQLKTRVLEKVRQRASFGILACSNRDRNVMSDALYRRIAFATTVRVDRYDGQDRASAGQRDHLSNPNLNPERHELAKRFLRGHHNDAQEIYLVFHAISMGIIKPIEMSAWESVSESFLRLVQRRYMVAHAESRISKQCVCLAEVLVVLRAVTIVRRHESSPFFVTEGAPMDTRFLFEVEKHLVCSEQDAWIAISLAEEILFPMNLRILLKGIQQLYERSKASGRPWEIVNSHNGSVEEELIYERVFEGNERHDEAAGDLDVVLREAEDYAALATTTTTTTRKRAATRYPTLPPNEAAIEEARNLPGMPRTPVDGPPVLTDSPVGIVRTLRARPCEPLHSNVPLAEEVDISAANRAGVVRPIDVAVPPHTGVATTPAFRALSVRDSRKLKHYLRIRDTQMPVRQGREPEWDKMAARLASAVQDLMHGPSFGNCRMDSNTFIAGAALELMRTTTKGVRALVVLSKKTDDGRQTAYFGIQGHLISNATLESPMRRLLPLCYHRYTRPGPIMLGNAMKREGTVDGQPRSERLHSLPHLPDYTIVPYHMPRCEVWTSDAIPQELRDALERINMPRTCPKNFDFLHWTVRTACEELGVPPTAHAEAIYDPEQLIIGEPEVVLERKQYTDTYCAGHLRDPTTGHKLRRPRRGVCSCFRHRPLIRSSALNSASTRESLNFISRGGGDQGGVAGSGGGTGRWSRNPILDEYVREGGSWNTMQKVELVLENPTDSAFDRHMAQLGLEPSAAATTFTAQSGLAEAVHPLGRSNRETYHPTICAESFAPTDEDAVRDYPPDSVRLCDLPLREALKKFVQARTTRFQQSASEAVTGAGPPDGPFPASNGVVVGATPAPAEA